MDLAKIKQRQALTGGNRWKLKEGPNNVRLFFFRHKVTEQDIKDGLYTRDKLGKVEVELDRIQDREAALLLGCRPVDVVRGGLIRHRRASRSTLEGSRRRTAQGTTTRVPVMPFFPCPSTWQ